MPMLYDLVYENEKERAYQIAFMDPKVSMEKRMEELATHVVVKVVGDPIGYIMVHGALWTKLLDVIGESGLIDEAISTIQNSIVFDVEQFEFSYKTLGIRFIRQCEEFPKVEVKYYA